MHDIVVETTVYVSTHTVHTSFMCVLRDRLLWWLKFVFGTTISTEPLTFHYESMYSSKLQRNVHTVYICNVWATIESDIIQTCVCLCCKSFFENNYNTAIPY